MISTFKQTSKLRSTSQLTLVLFFVLAFSCSVTNAQNGAQPRFLLQPDSQDPSSRLVDPTEIAALQQAAKSDQTEVTTNVGGKGIDAFSLLLQGGWVMVPLGIVSLFVVMWSFERLFSLRQGRLLPRSLTKSLMQMIRQSEVLPVQDAYQLCLKNPSVGSSVVATALVRTGRPLSEIEKSAGDALQREVDTATGPVRWLAFLAGVAPLLGLLGTVWGLIRAFHDTTQLDPTQNRAEVLATGIYEALVTTLVGLIIAIPAAAIAQYFENRILRQFRRIEDLVALLLPRLEYYEGRVRFDPIGRELASRDINNIPPRVNTDGSAEDVSGMNHGRPKVVGSPDGIGAERSHESQPSLARRSGATIRSDRPQTPRSN